MKETLSKKANLVSESDAAGLDSAFCFGSLSARSLAESVIATTTFVAPISPLGILHGAISNAIRDRAKTLVGKMSGGARVPY